MSFKKQSFDQRFPSYVPFYYRWYCLIRKLYRQSRVRILESQARQQGLSGIVEDTDGRWEDWKNGQLANPVSHINKCLLWVDEDLNRADIKAVTAQLETLKEKMRQQDLMFCSAAGTFVENTYTASGERIKLWENAWVLGHAAVKPGMRILDIGGASTPFSFYLADLRCSVKIIDNDWGNCGIVYNANYAAKKMGWDLNVLDKDVARGLPFDNNYFDRVFSICVIEHLSSPTRRQMMKEIGRVLKPGGIAALTTDYDHRRPVLTTDKGLRFGFLKKFQQDVLEPSGLSLMGNRELIDAKPEENFLGAFFLTKSN